MYAKQNAGAKLPEKNADPPSGHIGTTTSCAYGFTSVVGATDNSVTVQYKWPRGNEANAEASGRATRTFTWVDGQVLMDPPLPAEIPRPSGC